MIETILDNDVAFLYFKGGTNMDSFSRGINLILYLILIALVIVRLEEIRT